MQVLVTLRLYCTLLPVSSFWLSELCPLTLCRVEVLSSWLPDTQSDVEVVVGYLSGLGGRRGVVTSEDKEVSFPLDVAQSAEGYRPHLNDWVKVGVVVGGVSSVGVV